MIPLYDETPRTSFPIVTVGLIAVNIVVFLWQQAAGNAQYLYTMIPSVVTHGIQGQMQQEVYRQTVYGVARAVQSVPIPFPALHPYWLTIFSSMFMHGGWLHIGGNMLYLWIFGDNIEDDLGPVKYLLFYLVVGFLAAAAQIAADPLSTVPTLGASGAIAGVMGGYILLHPHVNVRALVPLGFFTTLASVPAWVVLGFWFVYQVIVNQTTRGGDNMGSGGVAYMAHIGGFLAGLILIKLFGPKRQTTFQPYGG